MQTTKPTSPNNILRKYFSSFYLFLVIFFANKTFFLLPWSHLEGKFNSVDIGTALILGGIIVSIITTNSITVMFKSISILIFIYFLIVGIHIGLATMYYHQGVFDGIVAARHQLYYCSFFIFWFHLRSIEDIRRLMNMLSAWCLIIIILSVFNYFFPIVFYNEKVAGHGIRFGIKRAYVPQMGFFSIIYFWFLSKLAILKESKIKNGFSVFSVLSVHFFRMSRMRLVGISLTTLLLIIFQKKFKLAIVTICFILLAFFIVDKYLKTNIIYDLYYTSFTDFTNNEGTWKARESQLQYALQGFKQNPILGTGTVFIRDAGKLLNFSASKTKMMMMTADADLGYPFWARDFGIIGIFWLSLFIGTIFIGSIFIIIYSANFEIKTLGVFLSCSIFNLILTGFTLNHFTRSEGIIIFGLLGAILYRTKEQNTKTINQLNNSIL